jgi:hypothetical protein
MSRPPNVFHSGEACSKNGWTTMLTVASTPLRISLTNDGELYLR